MSTLLYPSHLLSGEQAQDVLKPHISTLSDCFGAGVEAWQRIRRSNPDDCLCLPTRTWAGIIHANTVRAARLAFRNQAPNVLLYNDDDDDTDDNAFFAIDFYGKIILRFKKLRHDLRPSSHKSGEQDHFKRQEPEPLLYAPAATLATSGYRLDRFAHSIRDIHVVCWLGDVRLWALPLPLPAVAARPIAVGHVAARTKTKIRAKDRRKANEQ
jgi:hypothetical protein